MPDTIKADGLIEHALNQLNDQLGTKLKSEVIAIRSVILTGLDDHVRDRIEEIVEKAAAKTKTLPRLNVLLETNGGQIETVERISNVFRKHFREVDFIIPGYAYSAGTVLVLSGDNIYMDYYSVLGPIDPQIENDEGKLIPGMGYLYMYDELAAKKDISQAEAILLSRRFDPAIMFIIRQAKNHAEDLIKEWLPKYKFKNWKQTETKKLKVTPKMKRDRAKDIAEILGEAERWHSHGRGITMRELTSSNIKLKIEDFGSDATLNPMIRQYYDLFVDYGMKVGAQYATHTKHGFRRVG